jgi:hypothetical protein
MEDVDVRLMSLGGGLVMAGRKHSPEGRRQHSPEGRG